MPQYADLTQTEQAQLDELMLIVRPLMSDLYKFAQKNRVALQLWFTNPQGSASTLADLVDGLTAGALVPNKTGLAGAESVTKAALQSAMGYVSTVAAHDSVNHLNVMLPFAGSANFLP